MFGRLRLGVAAVGLAGASVLALAVVGAQARPGAVGAAAGTANEESGRPAISANGRFVAFESLASNLVAGETSRWFDLFARDRVTKRIERVSVSSGGRQANGPSARPVLSANGRFVAFVSDASNLVAGDTNRSWDVFLRDRVARTTVRVSVGDRGQQASSVSFSRPGISADGRFVAFVSAASNLVAGDTNRGEDAFVRDRVAGKTERVSVSGAGGQANGASSQAAISAGGRLVAFTSRASNLVPGDAGTCEDEWGYSHNCDDVFVRDRVKGTTTRVSVGGGEAFGDSGQPAISANGRFVVFQAFPPGGPASSTPPGVFVRDLAQGKTERMSIGRQPQGPNGYSYDPSISADGRFVGFRSDASNLVAADTNRAPDVFLRDRIGRTTSRVSLTSSGKQQNRLADTGVTPSVAPPAISATGRFVAFESAASNLAAGDTNHQEDVFLRDRKTGTTTLVSVGR